MGSRENEKLEKTKRRLAAVAFLTNISLNGTHKDTSWCLEYARQEATGLEPAAASTSKPTVSIDNEETEKENVVTECPQAVAEDFDDGELDLEDEEDGSEANEVPDSTLPFSRFRANTGSSEASLKSRHRHRFVHNDSDLSHLFNNPKHAHFSSTESFDHGARLRQISTSNISECSSQGAKELKILNLREIPMPKIRDERLVIMLAKRTPLLIFSALPYSRNLRGVRSVERADTLRRQRNPSGNRPLSALSDPDPLEQLIHNGEEELSYGYLLQPTPKIRPEAGITPLSAGSIKHKTVEQTQSEASDSSVFLSKHPVVSRCVSYDSAAKSYSNMQLPVIPAESIDSQDVFESQVSASPMPLNVPQASGSTVQSGPTAYSPHLLDDPEFRAGKHRTLLTFPSYITSVIDYCKASDLKKELNDKFKDRFPNVQLTLSKLRSLKREMRRIAKTECCLDVLTVAQAYVYFEKLILGAFVTKYNRKLCSGACLLLSAKLNDVKGESLNNLMEKVESTFRLNRKDLLSFEFAVLVALEFALHVPTSEVYPHYQRLIYEC